MPISRIRHFLIKLKFTHLMNPKEAIKHILENKNIEWLNVKTYIIVDIINYLKNQPANDERGCILEILLVNYIFLR